jgi:hypothetical protein
MGRGLISFVVVGAGIVISALSFVAAQQPCPPANGVGPPGPTNCTTYVWTTEPLAILLTGVAVVIVGIGIHALSLNPTTRP